MRDAPEPSHAIAAEPAHAFRSTVATRPPNRASIQVVIQAADRLPSRTLVILDLMMPDVKAFQTYERIRTDLDPSPIRISVLNGVVERRNAEQLRP